MPISHSGPLALPGCSATLYWQRSGGAVSLVLVRAAHIMRFGGK